MDPPVEQLEATIELDDRLYLAPCSSVPMVLYVLAVDSDARRVSLPVSVMEHLMYSLHAVR
jgi:hypothetical protein